MATTTHTWNGSRILRPFPRTVQLMHGCRSTVLGRGEHVSSRLCVCVSNGKEDDIQGNTFCVLKKGGVYRRPLAAVVGRRS